MFINDLKFHSYDTVPFFICMSKWKKFRSKIETMHRKEKDLFCIICVEILLKIYNFKDFTPKRSLELKLYRFEN
jgi:hypothetical protein